MNRVPPRALIAALVTFVALLAGTASAGAFSLDRVTSAPNGSNGPLPGSGAAAAGAHPNLVTTLDFSDPGSDTVRSLQIHLAPGMVAYVNHIPTCTRFDPGSTTATTGCADSVVGTTNTTARALGLPITLPPLPGTIYKIPPPTGSPAAFGIDVAGVGTTIKLVATISVDPHDLGLTATLDNLPRTTEALGLTVPIQITSITQTFNGYGAGSVADRSFFTNPTSCIPAATVITATSWDGVTATNRDAYTPTDCENVPFDTTLASSAEPNTADSTSAITTDVMPGQQDVPRVSSMVRNTTFIGPPGLLLNPALAARLDACTDAGFQLNDTSVAASCPASSEVGTIDFTSPILGNFPGKAYFGTQTPTDRLRLFLDVPLFGAHIKLAGTVNPDFRTGQITLKFSDLPQVAFTSFKLTFVGGARSALVTPTTCGTTTTNALVTPWSGGAARTPSGSFQTVGCERRFTPSMTTGVSTPQAGASPSFTLTFDRPDRTVPVGGVTFHLPAGLVGSLGLRGLTQCPLVVAAAGDCPDSSRVGSVESVIGSGAEPVPLPGSAYITAPKVPGDPAGLSVKVPAHLGPVDAGTVIVGQRLVLRGDGGLDVVSDPIPGLQFGIPLAIRRLTVNIDRQGFMRNPTSCGAKTSTGSFVALDGGPGADASSQLTISGCDRLPFTPRIRAVIGSRGRTKVSSHPPFTTTVTQKPGEAALKVVRVTLPRSVSTNLPTISAACVPADLAANRCSERTHIGDAKAVSPLVNRPLTGKVWFVRVGTALPKLVVQLRGPASIDLEGINRIGRNGVIITTFGAIPDLTISSFELKLRGGPTAVLTAVRDLCASTQTLATHFEGQNGKQTNGNVKMSVEGCPPRPRASASLKFRRGAGRLAVKVRPPKGAKPLSTVRVTLPRGLSLGRSARASVVAKAGRKRLGSRAVRVGKRAIALRLGRRGAKAVSISVKRVSASRALARRLATARGRKALNRRGSLNVKIGTRLTNKQRVSGTVQLKLR